MNTQTAQPGTQPSATIVEASKLPAVQPSGIVNKTLIATNENVETFCKLILAGLPTGKVFPHKVGDMEFSDEQKNKIANARTTHRRNARHNKAKTLAMLKGKNILLTGHKTNHSGEKGRVNYVKDSLFKKKTPAATTIAIARFFGEEVPQKTVGATPAAK